MSALATYEIISLFPEMFRSVLEGSLLGKAIARGLVEAHCTDPRQWGLGRHRSVDDTPYGGGAGMVMRPEPLVAAIEHVEHERGPAHKVLLTPTGRPIDRAAIARLATQPRLLLVCGRYEGVDERVSAFVDEELSLGDFVLTGGELAAMAVIDACARRLPGVLGNEESPIDESFEQGLLEHPQYTRPPEFRGLAVPELLLSGDHARVRAWRRREALCRTRARRPDLWARHRRSTEDHALLDEPDVDRVPPAARAYAALVHHPVLDRDGQIITTALTNLDLHDLARSCRTYGLAGFRVVTPIAAQRALAERILGEWRNEGVERNDHRREALSRVAVDASVEDSIAAIVAATHQRPLVVATSARETTRTPITYAELATASGRPLLLLFGTGWGLADAVLDRVDRVLPPIRGAADFNHLSVRSAAAIVLDRVFGRLDRSAP